MATKTVTKYRNRPKAKHHRRSGFTLPLAVIAGLAAPATKVWDARSSGFTGMANVAGKTLTGYDFNAGTWNIQDMKYGLLPMLAGFLVHWLVGGRLGVNRAIARAGIPFVRL